MRVCSLGVLLNTIAIWFVAPSTLAQTPGELKWRLRSPNLSVFSVAPTLGTNGFVYGAAWPELFAWDAGTGALQWSTNTEGRVLYFAGALVVGPEGNVYVATDTGLEAYNGRTGAKLWKSAARGALAVGGDGTVYASAHTLQAIDPVTGSIKWSALAYGASEYVPPALAANGMAYVTTEAGAVVAVDTTGVTGGWFSSPSGHGYSLVIVAGNGTVVAGRPTGDVVALDGMTGRQLWKSKREGIISDMVLSADGSVCVAQNGGWIYVRDLESGEVTRRLPLKNCERTKLAFAEDGTLYAVTRNYAQYKTQLLALDFATGRTNWFFEPNDYEASALTIGNDGTVYFQNGYIYAIHGGSPLANTAWPRAQQNAQNSSYWRVAGPPSITRQPHSQWSPVETSTRLHVYTPVMRPVFFQWYFDGQPIAGATNDSYFIDSVSFSAAGRYSVALSNEFGRAVSDEATLSVGYALQTTAVGPGWIRRVPDLEVYPTNSVVEVTAMPGRANHTFVGWSGDATGSVRTLTITLDRNYAITGEFAHVFADIKWTNDFGHAPALGTNGYLYAFSDGYITAIDTRDGRTVFKDHYFDSWWAPGAVGRDGTLYIGNYSGSSVWAHDGTTGDPKGGYTVDVCVHACPAIGVDGTIYLSGRHLYAADPLRYREYKWVFEGGNIFESSPAVGANGLVYAGSMDGKMYAVDSVTGLKRWDFVTGDAVYSSPALGADGTVYFGSYDGSVYALNGDTGEKRWEFATGGTVPASPVVGPDGTVYIGSMDNKVYALNGATGAKRWEFLTGDGVLFTAALAADGALYVGSADGWLYVLDSQTGEKIWQLPGASTPTIGPDGTIYSAGYAMYGTSPLANTPWPKFHATLDNRGRVPGRPVIDRSASRITDEGFALTVHAEIGDVVRVDWSTNLVNWTILTTATSSTGRVDIVDSAATAQPKFYRATVQR
jgi:uncharacterized repeat protein (TIGR02543 family)